SLGAVGMREVLDQHDPFAPAQLGDPIHLEGEMAADVDEDDRPRPVLVDFALEILEGHAEVVAVAVDELDVRPGVDGRQGRGHEGVRRAEDGLPADLRPFERGQRRAGPPVEGDRLDPVPAGPGFLELDGERSLAPPLGVEDAIPELVQAAAVAGVEPDGETREGCMHVRSKHRAEAYSWDRPARFYTGRVDAQALSALELPAILERLATSAETEQGAAAARALAPSSDALEVARRQALTTEAVALLDGAVEPTLAGASDPRGPVSRAERGGTLQPSELRGLATTIHVALEARRVLHEQRELAPRLAEHLELVSPSVRTLAESIDRAIEEDGSDLRDSASPLLRRLRRELRSGGARVRDELARVARSSEVRDALQESFFAERGGRPVLAVRAAERARVAGIVH